jgi:DegV family protein with EDD domain
MTHSDLRVAVVTDSAASLPSHVKDELGVCVVPMTIAIGGQVHSDGELDPVDVARLAAHHRLTTSAPSPGAYLEVLEQLSGRPAVIVTVARSMSASFDAATTAASYADAGHVVVVDAETAAGGQALVVTAAGRAAQAGGGMDQVAAAARDVSARVRLFALLDQLDQLARSGRVPGIAARAGRSLGMRAVFELSRGHVLPRLPARTIDGAVSRIVPACRAGKPPAARLHAVVLHAQAPRAAESLLAAARELDPAAEVDEAPFSPVMVAHTGPGLAGLAWWWERLPQSGSAPAA